MSAGSPIPEDILNDLSSRFIINVPKKEREGLNRVSFQIELAHWFYLDYYCVQNPSLKACRLKEFYYHIFKHIPFLRRYEDEIDDIFNKWRSYKLSVPTFGAIILDETMTNVLMVQGYLASSWSFPKGKVNQEEDSVKCAIREVLEETGVDISSFINPEEYIESTIHDQLIRLYIVVGVDRNVKVKPQTRNEIRDVQWIPIEQLPVTRNDVMPKGLKPDQRFFYMVTPFMKRLLSNINYRKANSSASSKRIRRSRKNGKATENDNLPPLVDKVVETVPFAPKALFSYYTNEQVMKHADQNIVNEELQNTFSNININSDAKDSSTRSSKRRNRKANKVRSTSYDEFQERLERGSERWAKFRFDRERISRPFSRC